MNKFRDHAVGMGAVLEPGRVETIYPGDEYSGDEFTVMTRDNRIFSSRAVILATGIQQARLLPGEKELLGRGLGYVLLVMGLYIGGRKWQ